MTSGRAPVGNRQATGNGRRAASGIGREAWGRSPITTARKRPAAARRLAIEGQREPGGAGERQCVHHAKDLMAGTQRAGNAAEAPPPPLIMAIRPLRNFPCDEHASIAFEESTLRLAQPSLVVNM